MAALEEPPAVFTLGTPYARAAASIPVVATGTDGRRLNRLGVNPDAPLPLGYTRSVRQACKLKALGLSWVTVAVVMNEYHGLQRCDRWWRAECHKAGAPKEPRGNGSSQLHRHRPYPQLWDKAWLRANADRRTGEIAAELGCGPGSVNRAYARAGIRRG